MNDIFPRYRCFLDFLGKTFFFIFLVISKCYSQGIDKISFKTFGLKDNLSSANVRKIIKDKNNFLWVSTQDGLNKFNGNSFINFTKNNLNIKHQLLGIDCFGLEYSEGDSLLYVLTSYEGVNCINIQTNEVVGRFPAQFISNSKTPTYFNSLKKIKNFLIVSSNTGILYVINLLNKTVVKKNTLFKNENDIICGLFEYNNMLGVVVSNKGILLYDTKDFNLTKELNFKDDFDKLEKVSINIIKDEVWLSTNKGIVVIDLINNSIIDLQKPNFDFPQKLLRVYTTATFYIDSTIYISNINGFYKWNIFSKKTSEIIFSSNNDQAQFLKSANSILINENGLWIAGTYGLAHGNVQKNKFNSVYKSFGNSQIKLEHTYGIRKNNFGEIFIGGDDGIYIIDKIGNIKRILETETFFSLEQIFGNDFIFSGSKHLWYYKNGNLFDASILFPELNPIKKDIFISIVKFKNKILFSSQLQNGLFVWDLEKHNLLKINKNSTLKINDLLINNVLIDGKKVFVISESKIEEIDLNKNKSKIVFETQYLSLKEPGIFMDMCKLKGNYYIAGYGIGIIKTDSNFKVLKTLTNVEGVKNIGLFKIFPFQDSLIMATSNNGLFVYSPIENKVRAFYEEDGLHSNAFEETSGFQQGDSIFAGGIKGFTIFDTKKYTTNSNAPKLYFDNISINTSTNIIDTTNLFLQNLEIPNNYTQAKISFVGLNYQNPTRVNYWYRITELGTNWIDLKTQNFIDLIGISPGKYHLEVKAANEDGVECAAIKMELHFLPKWYQTLGFKILLILLIAGLLFTLYNFRIKQLKKVLAVRQKISQNLHDDIGSTLSAINMYTQVAKLQPQENHFLNSIEENTKDVLGKLDDIIWSTNPKNDKVQNLVERMDAFARPLCNAHNINFIFEQNNIGTAQKISEPIRQNIFIVFKEAINNALKYAQCKNITVVLEEKNKNIACAINDDGIGFEPSKPTERNGLLNMQLRAKELKGICTITSEINKGSVVFIQLPL